MKKVPLSTNPYLYGHADPINQIDPSGLMTLGGMMSGLSGMASMATMASFHVIRFLGVARAVNIMVAGPAFVASQGPRITQFLQGTGPQGLRALQTSIHLVARGQTVTQQTLTSAMNLGSSYTARLNSMLNVNANSLGMQYHKLIEASFKAPSNITYSLNNIVPTPHAVHRAISTVHSTSVAGKGSMTLRVHITNLLNSGKLTYEALYQAEARIWSLAMQRSGGRIDIAEAINIVSEYAAR
jgi:hypothetical protein